MAEYSMKARTDGIVVFCLPSQSRSVIDCWMEDLSRLGRAWIEDEQVLLMIDMHGAGIPTPYNQDSLQKVSKATSATSNIYTAFVLDAGTAMTLSGRFMDSLGPLFGNKRAFSDEDAAINWLSQKL